MIRPLRRFPLVALLVGLLLLPAVRTSRADEGEDQTGSPAKPFLWVTEGATRIYLFGTIHVPRDEVTQLPDIVKEALKASDVLVNEAPMDAASQMKAQQGMQLPTGQNQKEILSEELYGRVKKLMPMMLPEMMWQRMSILAITSFLELREAMPDFAMGKQSLDSVLYQQFLMEGKKTDWLETYEEQIKVVQDMEMADQIHLLEVQVEEIEKALAEGRSLLGEMLERYLAGDEEKLDEETRKHAEDDPVIAKLLKMMLDDRNVRMVDRMLEKAKAAPDKVHFVAVGAGHYGGEKGILKLLKAKGYSVKRLKPGDELPERPAAESEDR